MQTKITLNHNNAFSETCTYQIVHASKESKTKYFAVLDIQKQYGQGKLYEH